MRLRLGAMFGGAGFALALSGAALAQPAQPEERSSVERETPWFERFTSGTAPTLGFSESRLAEEGRYTLKSSEKWGISVDTRRDDHVAAPGLADSPEQSSVSAFFNFTPRLRVSGSLSVAEQPKLGGKAEQNNTVKLESAFKF